MRRLSWRRRLLLNALNILALCFLVLPLLPVVLGSLQSEKTIQQDVHALIPDQFTLANFRLILSGGKDKGLIFDQISYLPASIEQFPNAFLNSVIVASSVTLITLAISALSAYTIARMNLRWTRALLQTSIFSRMVPLIVLMVPLYVLFRGFGLLNSLGGIVLAEVGFLLPYAILILTPYFASLPVELEEAARLDGCSRFGALVRIVLPLTRPALASCGVIMFIISWHELLIPLILTNKPAFMTVPVVLAGLVSDFFVFYTLLMALCLIGLLPTVVLVLVLQKYIVAGLTAGAVKG
ncbi:MAG: carbohydrate ABC transporter permease [Acetobacteraceae bacterium]|nr:carbohydrate ABC transporter permease [Acetobacteraceae bacterium]